MTSLKFPITAKFSVLVLVAVVATAFAINAVYLRGINRILIERALHDLEQETEFFKYPLDVIISELKEDVRLLVQLPAIPGMMRARFNNGIDPQDRATEAQWTDRLASIFTGMLRTHPRYLRIRFAGVADGGKELVRVEELQRGEEELRTQQEELQASNEELEEKTLALEEQNAQIRQQAGELQNKQLLLQQKAQELELSGKYKSEFLANMSHELRTPLNSLLIQARSLAGNEEGNLTEEQIEEARVIHNGGLKLLGLINDILDLSKVEAGKLTIIAEDTPISGIVKRLRQQFDQVAKEAGLVFSIEVEDDVPAALHTDSQRVEQILKNLLA